MSQLTGTFLESTVNVVSNATPNTVTSISTVLDTKPISYLYPKTGVIKLDTTVALEANGFPSDNEQIHHINTDKENNLYMVGRYTGGKIFHNIDGTNSNIERTSYNANVSNGFVVKYVNGRVSWVADTVPVNGYSYPSTQCLGINFDSNNDVYVVGSIDTTNNAAFSFRDAKNNISPRIVSTSGNGQGFLVKFTAEGVFQWIVLFDIGGYFSYENFWFGIDKNNNVLLSSRTRYNVSIKVYRPNTNTLVFEDASLIGSNVQNIYTFRFSSSGQYLERYIIKGDIISDYVDFAVDNDGNMYNIFPYIFYYPLENPLITVLNNYNQVSSVFLDVTLDTNLGMEAQRFCILKMNSDGVCQWITKIDTTITTSDIALSANYGQIKVDKKGDIIVALQVQNYNAFQDGIPLRLRFNNNKYVDISYNLSRDPNEGVCYLAKYSSNGLCQWATFMDYTFFTNININQDNNIYVMLYSDKTNIHVYDTTSNSVVRQIQTDISGGFEGTDVIGAVLEYTSNGVISRTWKYGGYNNKDLRTMVFDTDNNMYVGINLIDRNQVNVYDASDNFSLTTYVYSCGVVVLVYDKNGRIVPSYSMQSGNDDSLTKTIINRGYPKYYLIHDNETHTITDKEYKLEWNGFYWSDKEEEDKETAIMLINNTIDRTVITRIDPNSAVRDYRYLPYNNLVKYKLYYLVKTGRTFYKDWYYHDYIGNDSSGNSIYSYYILYTGKAAMHSIGFNELKVTVSGVTSNSETLKLRVYYYKKGDTNNPTFSQYWTLKGSEQKIVHIPSFTCLRLMYYPADNSLANNFSIDTSSKFSINRLN